VDIVKMTVTDGEYAHSGKVHGPRVKECKLTAIATMQVDLRETRAERGSGEES
jgi:hypothetical protein